MKTKVHVSQMALVVLLCLITGMVMCNYAFAASDEGWNRLTIANRPQDSYYESRQRIRELTLYAKQVLTTHYGRGASRTLMMGGSNGGHHPLIVAMAGGSEPSRVWQSGAVHMGETRTCPTFSLCSRWRL